MALLTLSFRTPHLTLLPSYMPFPFSHSSLLACLNHLCILFLGQLAIISTINHKCLDTDMPLLNHLNLC
jgi:hypothetical protein